MIGTPYWDLSGVNIFSANLVRGLRAIGYSAHILLTEEDSALLNLEINSMAKPTDIPFEHLPVEGHCSWGGHWGAMIRYLEELAPCLYIPNSDWRHSCVSPLLTDGVSIIGVVHSDDPLHYDHVTRLGKHWNAVVATSQTIAKKTLALDPSLESRTAVIPIGVHIPEEPPVERPCKEGPLRILYAGVLKQHQKRILDLPAIISAAVRQDLPVALTVAGSGPDEVALREACSGLEKRGLVRFLGIVEHKDVPSLLESHDVFLMTSEFEGMPNALLEAMGRGCIPLVTKMESAVPDLIENGHNGHIVPIGAVEEFVDRLRGLQDRPRERKIMARNAYETVASGNFRVHDMVASYAKLIDQLEEESGRGSFRRPSGTLCHPPKELDGVSIFPLPTNYLSPALGLFGNRERDFKDFVAQLEKKDLSYSPPCVRALEDTRRTRRSARRALKNVEVVVTLPRWSFTGICTFAANLVRELRSRDIPSHILLTAERETLRAKRGLRPPKPTDVPFASLPLGKTGLAWVRLKALRKYLEDRAPCIYLPNQDFRMLPVSSVLPEEVVIVGAVLAEEEIYFDNVRRFGRFWNSVAAFDPAIVTRIRSEEPALASRTALLPYGYSFPRSFSPSHRDPSTPLRIVSPGYFREDELSSLAGILEALTQSSIPFELRIVEPEHLDEPTSEGIRNSESFRGVHILDALPRNEMWSVLEESDVLLLLALHHGNRHTLVEAFGRCCIPAVVENGSTEDSMLNALVKAGAGLKVPHGQWKKLSYHLNLLHKEDSMRQKMALLTYEKAAVGQFTSGEMAEGFLELFAGILDDIRKGLFARPPSRASRSLLV